MDTLYCVKYEKVLIKVFVISSFPSLYYSLFVILEISFSLVSMSLLYVVSARDSVIGVNVHTFTTHLNAWAKWSSHGDTYVDAQ